MKILGDKKVSAILKDYLGDPETPLTAIAKKHKVSVSSIMRKVEEYDIPMRRSTNRENPDKVIESLGIGDEG